MLERVIVYFSNREANSLKRFITIFKQGQIRFEPKAAISDLSRYFAQHARVYEAVHHLMGTG